MINRDDIEAGDKCYTRDGGCLVARQVGENLILGHDAIEFWERDGQCSEHHDHPLDIIRIEKEPKPVELLLCMSGGAFNTYFGTNKMEDKFYMYNHVIKLTIINGKLEKSEQVK